jgi:thioredoxin 1
MARLITIEVFSASICNRCGEAKKRVQTILKEFADRVNYREIDVVDEIDYAVSLGVLTTPTIVIDGEVVFTSMPSVKQLRLELQRRLTD